VSQQKPARKQDIAPPRETAQDAAADDAELTLRDARRSFVTDRPDQGGDEETDDGLPAQDEALRQAIEEDPVGPETERDKDRVPVFDRGEAVPKI